jgi:hypothetical protein
MIQISVADLKKDSDTKSDKRERFR